jgi:crotonyl-CoA carboxylase/reductase
MIDPCLGRVYAFTDIGQAHDDMAAGTAVSGNRVALVGAPGPGLGRSTGG